MGIKVDLTGKRFHKLHVVGDFGVRNENKKILYRCKCDCGNYVDVVSQSLTSGATKSCGCWKKEHLVTHRDTKTRLYRIWANMLSRCRDKNSTAYKFYGEKGVSVCNEWISFTKFRDWSMSNGYTASLTVDRIDPNGNYEPSNCRWATRKQQDWNKRNTRYANIRGTKMTLGEISEKFGLSFNMIAYRHSIGINDENILKPYQRGKKLEQI